MCHVPHKPIRLCHVTSFNQTSISTSFQLVVQLFLHTQDTHIGWIIGTFTNIMCAYVIVGGNCF